MSHWDFWAELACRMKGPCQPTLVFHGPGPQLVHIPIQLLCWSCVGLIALVGLVLYLQNRLFCRWLLPLKCVSCMCR